MSKEAFFSITPIMRFLLLFTLVTIILSCGSTDQQVPARITQRQTRGLDKLVISYEFLYQGKPYNDSIVVDCQIIRDDSLKAVFASETPQNSRLLLP